ncbi:hypothetical protein Hanom_Chr04g00382501 [Helianthus anomalus]
MGIVITINIIRGTDELLKIGSRKSSKRAKSYQVRAELELKIKLVYLSSLTCEARRARRALSSLSVILIFINI